MDFRNSSPGPAASRFDVTVNVVVSGKVVLELKSTSTTDAGDLKKLTAELNASEAQLDSAVETNPVPKP